MTSIVLLRKSILMKFLLRTCRCYRTKGPGKKQTKIRVEKAEIAAAYHQNRAELQDEIDNCMADLHLLHNQLMIFWNDLFDDNVVVAVASRAMTDEELSSFGIVVRKSYEKNVKCFIPKLLQY